jgi:catechol 2,3-dioxygenase-like lactoylglutathione lyase family enzyme
VSVLDMYHTGIVVDDLEKAMDSYSRALGIRWAEPLPGSGFLRTHEGPLPRFDWFTYSIGGEHHIELLEQIDDTAWKATTRGPRLHHIGYWVDDIAAEIARFEELGFPAEIRAERSNGTPYMSYHLDPNGGLYIELVDRAVAANVEPWWSGEGVASFVERLEALGLDETTIREAFLNRRRHHVHPAHHDEPRRPAS